MGGDEGSGCCLRVSGSDGGRLYSSETGRKFEGARPNGGRGAVWMLPPCCSGASLRVDDRPGLQAPAVRARHRIPGYVGDGLGAAYGTGAVHAQSLPTLWPGRDRNREAVGAAEPWLLFAPRGMLTRRGARPIGRPISSSGTPWLNQSPPVSISTRRGICGSIDPPSQARDERRRLRGAARSGGCRERRRRRRTKRAGAASTRVVVTASNALRGELQLVAGTGG